MRDMAGEHIGLVLGDAKMPDNPLLIRKVRLVEWQAKLLLEELTELTAKLAAEVWRVS